MPMPYEESLTYPQAWDVVFDAAEQACDGRKRILLSSDRETRRIALLARATLYAFGAALVVDVEASPDGTVVRVGAVSGGLVDFGFQLRYHARNFFEALNKGIESRAQMDDAR